MSLKTQVLPGGTYLVLRQGLGVIISFVGKILSFGKIATWRISIAILAHLQGNRERGHGSSDLSLGASLSSSHLDCALAYSSRVRFPLAPSDRGLSFYLLP